MTIGWGFTHLDGELQRRDNVVSAGPSCCRRAQWPGYSPALSGLSTPTVNKSSHDSRKFRNAQKPLVFKAFWPSPRAGSGVDIDRGPKKSSKFFLRSGPLMAGRLCSAVRIGEMAAGPDRLFRSEGGYAPLTGPPRRPAPVRAKPALTITALPSMVVVDSPRTLEGPLGGRSGIPVKFPRPFCEGFARFCWGFPISGVQAVQIFGVSRGNHRKFALFGDDKLKWARALVA